MAHHQHRGRNITVGLATPRHQRALFLTVAPRVNTGTVLVAPHARPDIIALDFRAQTAPATVMAAQNAQMAHGVMPVPRHAVVAP